MRKKIKIVAMTVGGFLLCVAFVGLFIFSKSKGNDMKFSLLFSQCRGGADGLIVRFASA